MLQNLIAQNRRNLIERCELAVGGTQSRALGLKHGIPVFIDQVILSLDKEDPAAPPRPRSATAADAAQAASELENMAALHGGDLLERGFTLEQVVRDYGNFCQAVMNLAYETGSQIEVDEFATFNRCLDEAIAAAVTEFARRQSKVESAGNQQAANLRAAPWAEELSHLLDTSILAVRAIKAGNVGICGATGLLLDRSLLAMQHVLDRALAEAKLSAP